MKLTKAARKILHRSSIVKAVTMMIVSFQLFCVQKAHGAIVCGGPATEVCIAASNTFRCDSDTDGCVGTYAVSEVESTTSKCVGPTSGTNPTCNNFYVYFSDTDTKEQGMSCEGKYACQSTYIYFGDTAEKGTVTCTGGTFGKPACADSVLNGGCLICKGEHSCHNMCVYNLQGQFGECTGSSKYFQGSLGANCPVLDKKVKPALPALPACFSRANIVEVQNKGLISMDSLKIGDLVKTGETHDGQSQFVPVVSFMHVDPHAEVEYCQIFTSFSSKDPLEVSGDHFLFLHDSTIVRAQDVKVGDILMGDAAANMIVTHIKHIQRQGLYAPATENGKIWVSGVTASSYISLLEEGIVSTNMQALLSHMALAPLRMACNVGSFSICQNETYSEDGYSMNLWTLIQFGAHFFTLAKLVQVWIMIVVVPLLLVVSRMEMALHHGMWASILTVGLVVTISKMKTIAEIKATKK